MPPATRHDPRHSTNRSRRTRYGQVDRSASRRVLGGKGAVMTATLDNESNRSEELPSAELVAAWDLVRQALDCSHGRSTKRRLVHSPRHFVRGCQPTHEA